MNTTHLQLISSMIEYYRGDAKRIQHFIKVYNFASLLGRQEQLDEETLFILETAAIVHDIGYVYVNRSMEFVMGNTRNLKVRQKRRNS